jgi:hypothetical protein
MSWALPLPEAAQHLVWRFKTQSPTAAIASEPLETLFARGGHVKSPCGCGAVVRVDRYFSSAQPKSARCWAGVTRLKLPGSSQRLAATK